MTKQEIEALLNKSLKEKIGNDELTAHLISHIIKAYQDDCPDWEQLRYIIQEVNKLWVVLKHCSELVLIKEKADRMMKGMPRPKALRPK